MSDRDTALRALACLDLTDLSDDCRPAAVDALLRRAVTPWGPVAAICIWPNFIADARRMRPDPRVKIATVINFPRGGTDVERAVEDTREALGDGAEEIDLVVPWRALATGDSAPLSEMVAAVAGEVEGRGRLKAILETGELADPALIRRAADLAIAAGANFLKTSTGKTAVSATPEAAKILLEAISASGKPVGFKASGGIRTLADAALYLGLADEIMGLGWASPDTFRIGASGLLDALTAVLQESDR